MKRERVLLALACGCEVAVAVYVVLRVVQGFVAGEPNPALAPAGVHSSYFWRAWVAGYVGTFASLLVASLAPKVERCLRVATACLPWVAGGLVLQALWMP